MEEKLTETIILRVSKSHKAEIVREAKQESISYSQHIRNKLTNAVK